MLFAGLPAEGWQDYLFDSIESLSDPNKALVLWTRGSSL